MAARPYVIINVAQSLNGLISGASGRRVSISSREDLLRVHRLRASVDAIMVGANTVLCDNPRLLVDSSMVYTEKQPRRIVLDGRLRIGRDSNVLKNSASTIIYTSVKCVELGQAEIRTRDDDGLRLVNILSELRNDGMDRILVEGGRHVISEFIENDCIDEFHIFIGNVILENGGMNLFQPGFEIRDVVKRIEHIEGGVLISLDPHHLQRTWRTQVKDI